MRRCFSALAIAVTACGRIDFDPTGFSPADAALDAALGSGPFGPATMVNELSTVGANQDATLTADRLECYFSSTRPGMGNSDIWVSARAAVTDPWGTPTGVAELNTANNDQTPEIAADGLTLWLSSDRPSTMGGTDIYVATRSTRSAPWSTPVPVPELNTPSNESASAVDATQLRIVFHSNRGGNYDLYIADRPDTASAWNSPTAIGAVDTSSFEGDGFLGTDGLYFDSMRPGSGSFDLYFAATQGSSFAPPVQITSLDTPSIEQDPWVSDDLHYIMFTSTRTGTAEIYEASR
jgi:hypothetical protein